jgi:hypothetical protein
VNYLGVFPSRPAQDHVVYLQGEKYLRMNKWIFIVLVFLPTYLFAQEQATGNLTVFSEEGDRFFLYLNGEKQNDKAQSTIRIKDLAQLSYLVKIEFENNRYASISKSNVFISDGDDNMMEAAYKISRRSGVPKLKFYSMNTIKKDFIPSVSQSLSQHAENNGEETVTGNLTVFSEGADNFFLYLNGVQQNSVAQSQIRIEGLADLFYQVKLVFADSKIRTITKSNLSVSDGDDNLMDAAYKVSRHAAIAKLRFYAMNTVSKKYTPPPGMNVYQYKTSAQSASIAVKSADVKTAPVTTPVIEQSLPVKKDSAIIKPAGKKEVATKKTTPVKKEDKPAKKSLAVQTQPEQKIIAQPVPVVSKETPANNAEPAEWICENEWPMWKADYAIAKKNISEAKDEKLKMAAAKALAAANCLSCEQVIEITGLLTLEESRLSFAKFAYNHTIDIKNYAKVARVLVSNKSKEELNKFMKEK